MIHGEKVGLRARTAPDVAVLHAELYNDVPTQARADTRPWRPLPADGEHAPYALRAPSDGEELFSVVELSSGELAGEACLWRVDAHNRSAHLGLSLRPSFRGRGLGSDVVQALCRYGLTVRGLQRLQVETLSDNPAMISAAEKAGFVREGLLRRAGWVYGEWKDEVILGLLAEDWAEVPAARPGDAP